MLGIEIKTYTLQNAKCDHLLLALLFLCLVFLWRFFCFLFLLSLYRLFVFTIGIRFSSSKEPSSLTSTFLPLVLRFLFPAAAGFSFAFGFTALVGRQLSCIYVQKKTIDIDMLLLVKDS